MHPAHPKRTFMNYSTFSLVELNNDYSSSSQPGALHVFDSRLPSSPASTANGHVCLELQSHQEDPMLATSGLVLHLYLWFLLTMVTFKPQFAANA